MSYKNRPKDLCHCHAKRRLVWHQPSQAFFGYDADCKFVLSCHHRLYFIVGVIPNEDLAGAMLGWAGTSQDYFWYDNKKDMKAYLKYV